MSMFLISPCRVEPSLCVAATFGLLSFSALAQSLSVLHSFDPLVNATNQGGANPVAGLTSEGDVLVGAAVRGGPLGAGTVFSLSTNGAGFNVLYSLMNAPGAANPQAEAVASGSDLYVATFGGGNNGTGAILHGQSNGSHSVVFHFDALNPHTATNATGASPAAPVVLSAGTLYGTATAGGSSGNGVIYSVTTNGSIATVFHQFSMLDPATGTNADGAAPWGSLVLSGSRLYGTTSAGGASGNGTVYCVDTNGTNFNTLYSFSAMDPVTGTNTDGAISLGGLVLSNGTCYGTTTVGGFGNSGTLFSIGTNGSGFTVLHHFAALDPGAGTNPDGANPQGTLVLSGNTLYGSAPAGGSDGNGTIFSVRTSGVQFNTIQNFAATDPGSGTNTSGALPVGDLLLLEDSLYGTSFSGGTGSVGTVFRVPVPTAPAVITNMTVNPDDSVTMFFLGNPDSTHVVQTVTDLAQLILWQDASTHTANTDGSWYFTETNSCQSPVQYYRSYEPY